MDLYIKSIDNLFPFKKGRIRIGLGLLGIFLSLLLVLTTTGCTVRDMGINQDTEGNPRIVSQDYMKSIAEGYIEGHRTFSSYGMNPNVGTTTEAVWMYSAAYTFPAAPIRMEVLSSSGLDDVGSTGATSVIIKYLDANYNEHQEVVLLDGLNAVGTVSTGIFRIQQFRVATTGGTNTTQGNITLRGFGGGTVYDYILAGRTAAKTGVWTVPAHHTLYITSMLYSSVDAAKGVQFINYSNWDPFDGLTATLPFFISWTELATYNQAIYIERDMIVRFPEKVDIIIQCISGQAGALATVGLHGWLEDEGAE